MGLNRDKNDKMPPRSSLSPPSSHIKHLCLLLGDVVAATDVENVVKGAVTLNVEATLLGAACLGGADTGWVRTTARRWVWVSGWDSDSDRSNGGSDNEESHACRYLEVDVEMSLESVDDRRVA